MMNRKIHALMLSITMALVSLPAWATLSISTQPLFVTTATPPNIVVALDNSGSMASAFVPDTLDDSTALTVLVTAPELSPKLTSA